MNEDMLPDFALEPGSWVRHPDRPEWGIGQVQSVIGDRVTVNFENAGKLLINASRVLLEPLDEGQLPRGT